MSSRVQPQAPVRELPGEAVPYYLADGDGRAHLLLGQIYGQSEHPIPWLTAILNGVEHANFFEARATEYSKAATKGDWHGDSGVWSNFEAMMEKRKTAGAN